VIIVFDQSLADKLDESKGLDDSVLGALAVCAQQAFEGNHILMASRSVFSRLLAHEQYLSRKVAAILRRSADKVTQRKAIRTYSQRAIRIVATLEGNIPIRQAMEFEEEILISAFTVSNQSSLVAKPLFITENINDAKAYIKVVSDLVASGLLPEIEWLKTIPLRYEIAPGGGNTTAQLYKLVKEQGERVGAALADGDYRYPGGGVGETAKALLDVHAEAPKSALLEAVILPVRNAIPRATLLSTLGALDTAQGRHGRRICDVLEKSPFWRFYPLKSGIRCFELGQGSAESQFWSALFGGRKCEVGTCCDKKSECPTFVMPPISGKTLALVAAKPDGLAFSDDCLNGLKDVWLWLIKLIYSICCGTERVALI